jgi:hypothetical protein
LELFSQSPDPIDLYETSIFTARFEKPQEEGPLIEYLRALFSEHDHQLDLIVAMGGPAVSFAQRHRAELFPSAPMLITGVAQRRVSVADLTPNDTVVALVLDLPEYVRNILPFSYSDQQRCRTGLACQADARRRGGYQLIKADRSRRRPRIVTVEDSGPGIDPAVLSQLFVPFVTTKTNGMGMGLSILPPLDHRGPWRAAIRDPC